MTTLDSTPREFTLCVEYITDGRHCVLTPHGSNRVPHGDHRVPPGDHRVPRGDNRVSYSDHRLPQGDNRHALIVVERGPVQLAVDGRLAWFAARDAALVTPNRSIRGGSGLDPALWIARFDASDVDMSLPLVDARVHRLARERAAAVFAVFRLLAETGADRSAYRRLVRRLHFTAVVASVLETADVREFAPPRAATSVRGHATALAPTRATALAPSHATALAPGRDNARSKALVRDALEIIDRRYAEFIGPAEIARELGRHPAYLTNLVREATGKSLGTWLIERRLGAARVLLSKTDDPVGEIAAAVGYVDVSHFARYFTRRYGTPPARWRRLRSA